MTSAQHLFVDQYQAVGSLNIRYWQVGQGEDLCLLHGLNAMAEYWEEVVPFLANHFRVTVLDLPGFGRSSKPAVHYDLSFYANFLQQAFAAFGFKKIYLAGHSLGGVIALKFAGEYPEQVKKLFLIDSAGFSRQVTWIFRAMSIPFICDLLMYKNKKMYAQGLRLNVFCKDKITPELIEKQYCVADNPGHRATFKYILVHHANLCGMKRTTLQPVWDQFPRLQELPVFILWGENDRLLNISHLEAAKKYLPTAQIKVLKNCGHIPMLEYPEICAETMVDFFLSRKEKAC